MVFPYPGYLNAEALQRTLLAFAVPIGKAPLTVLAHQSYCTLYRATAWPSITRRPKNQVAHPAYSGLYARLDSALHSHSHDLGSAWG